MVRLIMNREEFAYDCISLVKAFYPKEKILLHQEEACDVVIVLDRDDHELRMREIGRAHV